MPIPIRLHAVLLAGALALGACGSAPVTPPAAMQLDGTGWVLSSLPGATLTERGRPTLQFSDGHVAGSDGCNRYSGRYESKGADFRVLPGVAATQMACEPAVDEQARVFMQALLHATRVRVDEAGLSLLDAGATTVAGFVAQSTELAGTSWSVTSFNDGRRDAVVGVLPGSEVTLEFGAGDTAAGTAGCNRYTTRYRRSGATLAFDSPAATRKACPQPGVMEQEHAFLAALANVATARIEGDRLELRRADGAIALVLHRAGSE
jgi:heat shock protein HslJ